MTVQEGLSAAELSAWRTFLRAHATVTRRLEAELVAEHELPLASYDVLVQLSESPDQRLRMTELADRVLLSRSGLTRLADRLELIPTGGSDFHGLDVIPDAHLGATPVPLHVVDDLKARWRRG